MASQIRIQPVHASRPNSLERAPRVHGPVTRILVVIVHVHVQGQTQLPQVALARGGLNGSFGPGECGQQQRSENGNDRDDHQQLDKREAVAAEKAVISASHGDSPNFQVPVKVNNLFTLVNGVSRKNE